MGSGHFFFFLILASLACFCVIVMFYCSGAPRLAGMGNYTNNKWLMEFVNVVYGYIPITVGTFSAVFT